MLEKVANDLLAEMMRSEMMRSDWLNWTRRHLLISWLSGRYLIGRQDAL